MELAVVVGWRGG